MLGNDPYNHYLLLVTFALKFIVKTSTVKIGKRLLDLDIYCLMEEVR